MPENMISVNGQSQVPPGFRFHPTEEELLQYYLRKKVSYDKIDLDVIRDVDLNKLEPWDIQERCKIGTSPQNDWYFFSRKDKKYPTGTRINRATASGFWKATGRDKVIYGNGRRIGMRKTLVFYKGRAPHGQKSEWIMHEYRIDDNTDHTITNVLNAIGEGNQEEGWVVCHFFKKKDFHRNLDSPMRSRNHMLMNSCDGAPEQRVCKVDYSQENNNISRFLRPIDTGYQDGTFMELLASVERPNPGYSVGSQNCYQPMITDNDGPTTNQVSSDPNSVFYVDSGSGLTNWVAMDGLVASQLNFQTETSGDHTMAYCGPTNHHDLQLPTVRSSSNKSYQGAPQESGHGEIDQWNFATSLSMSSSDY